MQRLTDPARIEYVLDAVAFLVVGFGVVTGVFAMRHLHRRHLGTRGAILHHVPHEDWRKTLSGADHPVRPAEELAAGHRRGGAASCAANAHFAVTIHGAEDGDRFTHAHFDSAN